MSESIKIGEDCKKIMNAMNDSVFLMDYDGSILEVNDAATKMLGYTREELFEIGLVGIDVNLINMSPEQLKQGFGKLTPESKPYIFQSENRCKDGKIIPVEISSSVIVYDNRQVIMSVLRDITLRKEAEEQAIQQLQKDQVMIKAVHHRIKNNIASIHAFLSLQMVSSKNEEVKSALQDTLSRVNCMKILYDTLLQSNPKSKSSTKDYFEKIVDSIKELYIEKTNISYTAEITNIHVSEKQLFPLGVVFEELITNSIKYAFPDNRQGSIRISLSEKDNHVKFVVQDNGIGLPKDFDLASSKGFGIMIVRTLGEQYNANFTLNNKNGVEAVFEFDVSSDS